MDGAGARLIKPRPGHVKDGQPLQCGVGGGVGSLESCVCIKAVAPERSRRSAMSSRPLISDSINVGCCMHWAGIDATREVAHASERKCGSRAGPKILGARGETTIRGPFGALSINA